MPKFHAVMIDETGCEFGVTLEAESRSSAKDQLSEDYPESRIDEIRTVAGRQEKEEDRDWEAQARYDEEWR